MNIPPGIKEFKTKYGVIGYPPQIWYSTWVTQELRTGSTIHTIEVDGKQWSVGDETNIGKIEAFKFSGNGKWVAQFVNNSSQYVEGLTTPTVKDSGGEERCSVCDRTLHHDTCTVVICPYKDPPTPINPSEPEERRWYDYEMKDALRAGFLAHSMGIDLNSDKWLEEYSQTRMTKNIQL